MSRSFKKNPFVKFFGDSDKFSKIKAHKQFRLIEKKILKNESDDLPIRLRDVSDIWTWKSDGGCLYVDKSKYDSLKEYYKNVLMK